MLDGKLNVHLAPVPAEPKSTTTDASEQYTRNIWPEVKLARDVNRLGIVTDRIPPDSYRIRVIIEKDWAISRADDAAIFEKLRKIQRGLLQSGLTYILWPSKLSPLLDGDFRAVARLIDNHDVSWTEALEAIFTTMEEHGSLRGTVSNFARLTPAQNEHYANFAWRIRDSFYDLPVDSQQAPAIRQILVDLLRNSMPRVWLEVKDKQAHLTTAQLVEQAIVVSSSIAKFAIEDHIYGKPSTRITLQGQAAPYYEMEISSATPSAPGRATIVQPNAMNTQTKLSTLLDAVHPGDERDGEIERESSYATGDPKCYRCGRPGYASDCNNGRHPPLRRTGNSSSIPSGQRNTTSGPSGQRVTLRGMLYNEDGSRTLGNQFRRIAGREKGSPQPETDRRIGFRRSDSGKPAMKGRQNAVYATGSLADAAYDDETPEVVVPGEDWDDDFVHGHGQLQLYTGNEEDRRGE
ncbi:MAG: hypothetical protein ACRYE7_00150 [Janthinobacterium lividum]